MLGFVPKMAGFVAVIHLLSVVQWQLHDAAFWGMWAVAAATMTVGNTLAFMQYNVKRMLAYSSVAHSGYMLMAILVGPGLLAGAGDASPMRNGVAAVLFYVALYGAMNLGAFAALSLFRKRGEDDADESAEMIDDLAGASRRHPWTALALSICVLGLMGFPLTGGFVGKLYLFSSVLSAASDMASHSTALVALVVIGALNAAIGAAYYLRIIASCYWREPSDKVTTSTCPALRVSLALCAVITLLGFIAPSYLVKSSVSAAASSRRVIDVRHANRSNEANELNSNTAGRRVADVRAEFE
jgi:NADH-quinone oxidoreductase subunit N